MTSAPQANAGADIEQMRQRLRERIRQQDEARGRPLTDRERLENLAEALASDDEEPTT